MRRGGARRRWITPVDAPVRIDSGRWGTRRVKVSECAAVIRAEDFYTELLAGRQAGARDAQGAAGRLTGFVPRCGEVTISWEL